MGWTPNRIVALGTGVLGIATAATAVAADLSGPESAGLVAGAAVVLGVAREWLIGWREYEERQGEADQPVGWEDLREQLGRVADLLQQRPELLAPPAGGAAGVSSLEYVASNLVDALRESVPATPPASAPPSP